MSNEFAWAVGVFEGEGCFNFVDERPRYIQVNSTDLDVLERVQKVFACGRIYGPYQRVEGHKPMYVWKTTTKHEMPSLLRKMLPLLGARRKARALEALAYLDGPRSRPHFNSDRCGKGHVYTDENTYIAPNGTRRCRQCMYEKNRAYRQRRKLRDPSYQH
jgi:hypothetical protein